MNKTQESLVVSKDPEALSLIWVFILPVVLCGILIGACARLLTG